MVSLNKEMVSRCVANADAHLVSVWEQLGKASRGDILSFYDRNGVLLFRMRFHGAVGACVVGDNVELYTPELGLPIGWPYVYVNLRAVFSIEGLKR
jgi:hypothetical protein